MKRVDISITLPVRVPVLCAGLGQPAFGVDAGFIRNEQGRPIIPRDHLKGLLRDALETLAAKSAVGLTQELIDDWLGQPTDGKGEPRSGRVILDDLEWGGNGGDASAPHYPRVSINEETGAAGEGMLAFFEQIALPGQELAFTGRLVAFIEDGEETLLRDALQKALKLIPAVGAMKSAGFGEVVRENVQVEVKSKQSCPQSDHSLPEGDSLTFDITFDRPVLFDAVHKAENLFVGSPVIPGSVIKGALAWLLQKAGENPAENEALSGMLVSHAFPLNADGERELEQPAPLCMASYRAGEDYTFRCHLGIPDDDLLLGGQPPFYRPDWKSKAFAQAREKLGYPPHETLRPLQRTRVAIEYDEGTARDEALFTEVALSERINGGDEKRLWRFTVHRNGADAEEFRRLAGIIRNGLWNMGRTNAAMQVEDVAASAAGFACPSFDGEKDTIALMLLTPAVMTDAHALGQSGQWEREAREAYQEYWQGVLGGGVELVDFMAAQRWAGHYQGVRFRPYSPNYYPFMLTEPGSVFLLKGKDLAARLQEALPTGHLPHAPLNGKAPGWRISPFVPENGYGRVRCITRAMMEGGWGDA